MLVTILEAQWSTNRTQSNDKAIVSEQIETWHSTLNFITPTLNSYLIRIITIGLNLIINQLIRFVPIGVLCTSLPFLCEKEFSEDVC